MIEFTQLNIYSTKRRHSVPPSFSSLFKCPSTVLRLLYTYICPLINFQSILRRGLFPDMNFISLVRFHNTLCFSVCLFFHLSVCSSACSICLPMSILGFPIAIPLRIMLQNATLFLLPFPQDLLRIFRFLLRLICD